MEAHARNPLKRPTDGVTFVLFGAFVFLAIGTALRYAAPIAMGDFKVVYYSARCLVQGGDPYRESDVLRVYEAEPTEDLAESPLNRHVKTRYFYPPTAFLLTVPIALCGFSVAKLLWTILSAGLLILAGILSWEAGTDYAPGAAGFLAGLVLVNSAWLYMVGNAAGIVVGLCVVAAWSFFREKYVWLGVLCLAVSLAVKPNDSGLIWLFLLMAGGRFRKRALQSLVMFTVLSLPVVLWVWHVSPHWFAELHANMHSFFAPGSIVDPSAAGMTGQTMDSLVQLQSVIGVYSSRPEIYNLITWAICGPLIAVAGIVTMVRKQAAHEIWLALAVAAPLSMLPTYHLQHDAKIILLTIPACAMLWKRKNRLGRVCMVITSAAIIICGDIFTFARLVLTRLIAVPHTGALSELATVVLTRPAALILLATAITYLWAYAIGAARPLNAEVRQEEVSSCSLNVR